MFRIKICGITTAEDAQAVAAAGADAIGLNFYRKSPRWIELTTARQVLATRPAGLITVGLFVNASADQVRRTFDDLGLDLIQLHGDEPPEYLGELAPRPVMKVFRVANGGLPDVREYLARCRQLGCPPRMVLLDSLVAGSYGGSGMTGDWDEAAQYMEEGEFPPLVLAGGLNPDNVQQAIEATHPYAVDTASGVEISAGRKSSSKVAAFVRAAKRGLGLP